ncbi:MAG: type II toxin-antitoxin system RelE/ParE family toxin [Pseudomonadota bacterium]
MKKVIIQPKAAKALCKMLSNEARRVRAKIDEYAANPVSLANNVSTFKGRPGIRLRVGDWRVIMEDDVVVDVLEIRPRGSIY